MKHTTLIGTLVLTILSGTAAAQSTVTTLPGTGNFQVIPLDIADDGSVMLGYDGSERGWLWERATGIISPVTVNNISALSGDGTRFVGEYQFPANNVWGYRNTPMVYEWPSMTSQFAIPDPTWGGCDDDVANIQDISGDGQVVAALVWKTCQTTPALYNIAAGTWQELPKSSPTISSKVSKLNRDGTVGVGWDNNSGRRGSVWINGVQTLLSVGADVTGEGFAISENGQWAAGNRVGSSGQSVWIWQNGTAPDAAINLGVVPTTIHPGNAVVVSAITNDGKTVLGFRGFGGDRDAFIWREGHGYAKLFDYLTEIGVLDGSQPFFKFTLCVGMSPTGRYLAAQGMDFGGTYYPVYIDLGAPVTPQCGQADVGSQGGVIGPDNQLDNNDFIAFISLFFAQDPRADQGVQGGLPGHDSAWDNNDFIAFINHFFAGC